MGEVRPSSAPAASRESGRRRVRLRRVRLTHLGGGITSHAADAGIATDTKKPDHLVRLHIAGATSLRVEQAAQAPAPRYTVPTVRTLGGPPL